MQRLLSAFRRAVLTALRFAVPAAFCCAALSAFVLFFSSSALAEETDAKEPAPTLDRGGDQHHMSDPGGCPVVCSRYEACIELRCVDTCRSGCRPGTYCTASGECAPLAHSTEAVLTEADRQRLSGAPSRDKKVLVFADIGGIIGFGFQLGLEYGVRHSMMSRLQALNTGIMSHAVFQQNEDQRFDWGFGTSLAYRYYEGKWGNLRGFYYGGGLEYTAISVVDRADPTLRTLLHSAAPFGEFGYRWVVGDIAYGFGPTLRLRYPIGTGFSVGNQEACNAGAACEDIASRRFEGTLHIEIGWFQ